MILLILLNFIFFGNDSILVKEKTAGGFQKAVSITSDVKENVYVLDANANQILKFSNKLEFKKRNGKQGWSLGQFDSPTYIDGSSGLDIFVSDGKNKRVQRLDLDLNPIAELKTNQEDFPVKLKFNTPVATLVLNSSQLYVIDSDNQRIVFYSDGRNPTGVFGEYLSGKGKLGRPVKLLRDAKNFIYILDKELKAIMKFDNLGNYISKIAINNLETFTIYGSKLYMFNGKEIVEYDLDLNSVTGSKKLPDSDAKKKYTDILILNGKKYLLLGKKEVSLWVEKN